MASVARLLHSTSAAQRFFSTSAARRAIYELRTYDIAPAHLGAFLKLTQDHIHLRTAHSPLLGYFTAELGAVSQVVHLWEYENYAQRTAVRAALAADPAWVTDYLQKILPLVQSQKNIILNPVSFYPVTPPAAPSAAPGVYELRHYIAKPGALADWQAAFQQGIAARCAYSKPVGIWFSEFGPLNSIVHLWRYDSLDHRMAVRAQALQDAQWPKTVAATMPFLATMESKALVPTAWSPMK